ncbi:MAG: hypothetical protein A4S09_03370 [Proteobacteria bacterium SG_bin7]|nr:MAG: hypothetical protein A4S09_03370 [Proteobacteria bacterium SG_bin7]
MPDVDKKIEEMLRQISEKELLRNRVVGKSVFKIRVLLMHLANYLNSSGTTAKNPKRGLENGK